MKVYELIGNLIGKRKSSTTINEEPAVIVESLVRSADEEFRYSEWIHQEAYLPSCEWLKNEYQDYLNNRFAKNDFAVIDKSLKSGVAISFNAHFTEESFQFLFDYLKDRIMEMPYSLQTAERRIEELGQYVKANEEYYLIPLTKDGAVNDPQFGKIKITQAFVNSRPVTIKLTTYKLEGENYLPQKPIHELLQYLFLYY